MNSSHSTNYPVIPSGNFKCVWMSAGVLSYQLCDRVYDCDSCPLDQAMRNHFVESSAHNRQVNPLQEKEQLHDDCLYSPHHCWIKEVGLNKFRVGIEPLLTKSLPNPKAIVLPIAGQHFKKGKVTTWVIYEEGIVPLFSPIEGEVIAVNNSINDRPEEAIQHPYENGWLYILQATLPLSPSLMNSHDAFHLYKQDSDRFKELVIRTSQHSDSGVGYTLHDGGQPVTHAYELLGQKKYLQLIIEVFGKP